MLHIQKELIPRLCFQNSLINIFPEKRFPALTLFIKTMLILTSAFSFRLCYDRQSVFSAKLIAEFTDFVYSLFLVVELFAVNKADGVCNNVIMNVSSVDMRSADILKTSLENFICKLHSDFMSSFVIHLSRRKGLYNVKAKLAARLEIVFLHKFKLQRRCFR